MIKKKTLEKLKINLKQKKINFFEKQGLAVKTNRLFNTLNSLILK
jgi:hypothetical protein